MSKTIRNKSTSASTSAPTTSAKPRSHHQRRRRSPLLPPPTKISMSGKKKTTTKTAPATPNTFGQVKPPPCLSRQTKKTQFNHTTQHTAAHSIPLQQYSVPRSPQRRPPSGVSGECLRACRPLPPSRPAPPSPIIRIYNTNTSQSRAQSRHHSLIINHLNKRAKAQKNKRRKSTRQTQQYDRDQQ